MTASFPQEWGFELIKPSLTPSLFIEVPVLSQENVLSVGVSIFLLDCGTFPKVWYFFVFVVFHIIFLDTAYLYLMYHMKYLT